MDKSTLDMIKARFSPQAFHDALSATIKQGSVVSVSQEEMEDKMEGIMKNMPWVDITMGVCVSGLRLRKWGTVMHEIPIPSPLS
jgi:hypothetical protein